MSVEPVAAPVEACQSHLFLCNGAGCPPGLDLPGDVVERTIRIGRGSGAVQLTLDQMCRDTGGNLATIGADLVEIATLVYSADQLVSRGGDREINYGERWRRRLHFAVPVRRPEVWESPEVERALSHALGFLTDDDYGFSFIRHPRAAPITRYFGKNWKLEQDPEEVLLFSGGLDSLSGAVGEVVGGGRKVILVSHRPTSKIATPQDRLAREIGIRARSRALRPTHTRITIHKGSNRARDFHQRSRSFLFASMAAVVARSVGLSRIRFFENGVVSLNLPISPQVLGGRASRTTHPRVLEDFSRLFSLLFEERFAVENSFLTKTKTEVVRLIRDHDCAELCALSVSCAKTWERSSQQPHCGACSQCVDRRIAALAAGLDEAHDPAEGYRLGLCDGGRAGAARIFLERYIGTALEIDAMNRPDDLLNRYGEVARALRYVAPTTEAALSRVFELYRRHARQVCEVLGRVVREHSDSIARRRAPEGSLPAIAAGRTLARGRATPPSSEKLEETGLVVDPEKFQVRYDGTPCDLGNSVVFRLVKRLSDSLGKYVPYEELRDKVWDGREASKLTIQRAGSRARTALRKAGITGLALEGDQPEHYRLWVRDSECQR